MRLFLSIVRCLTAALCCWCSSVPTAVAQPRVPRNDTLPQAVVREWSARDPRRSNTPQQVLRMQDLARTGATDMTAVLRRMAGVNLRDYGGAGGLKTVSVRGLGAAHTVVTYDGLAVGDARQGQTDLSRFTLEELSRVTLSVADAADLLTPVRNLQAATLSLTPEGCDTAGRGLHGRLTMMQASFGTYAPSLRLTAQPSARLRMGLSSHYFYARNDYPFTWQNGLLTTHERRTHSRMQTAGGKADLHATDRGGGQWDALVAYDDDRRQLPGQVILYTDKGTEQLDERRALAQLRMQRYAGRVRLMAAAKFDYHESHYTDVDAQYPGGRLEQDYRQREWYATAGAARRWGAWEAAYATDLSLQSLNSNQQTDHDVARQTWLQALSLRYGGEKFSATARLTAHLDWNENHGSDAARNARRLSPALTAGYRLASWRGHEGGRGELRARILYKESFRVPTFTECYYYHLGSQKLRPELARQLGLGLTLALPASEHFPLAELTADGYYNRIDDRISAIPYNLYVWRTENIGQTNVGGADVVLRAEYAPARRHSLLLSANYSWQRGADRTRRESQSFGKQPAYMPQHALTASLAYENPWVNLSAAVTAVSERWSTNEHVAGTRLAPYHEWSFGLYRQFDLGECRLLLRADLRNAFDRQYEVVRRYPMPGRSYRLSASVTF